MWDGALKIFGLVALDLGLLACLVLVPLGLPGNFLLLGLALAAAWLGHFAQIGWVALLVMLGLVLLAELVESLLGAAMTRRFGASWWGVGGAFLGGIAGSLIGSAVLPLIGTLVGAFLGAAAGAVLLEAWHRQRVDAEALRAGWGAFLGKLLASLIKVAVGLAIAVYIVVQTH
jgi:uncharacterized protein YqgC (DUF456 family)